MKTYIGTKIVKAWPALRVTTPDGKHEYAEVGDIVHPNAKVEEGYRVQYKDGHLIWSPKVVFEEGYRVQYKDGYLSWSPKAVFEEAYRETTGLSFGLAIEAAKMGEKIARAGWNGKNQYVELATCISYKNAAAEVVNVDHQNIGNKALAFVGTSGVQLGWLASQADMLANDWYIVE